MSTIGFDIFARDHASKTFDKLGASMKGAEGKATSLRTVGGLAMAAVAAAAIAFGKKSIDTFTNVGSETLTLQRRFGGSAESASRLIFMAKETGVSFESLGMGTKILSTHIDKNDKAWKGLGVSARDAHGNIKPMDQLMPLIAAKFAAMPNGIHKSAAAVALFGRNGLAMLPMLNRGQKGLAELGKESDRFGTTLSGKDTAAVRENIIAKRQMNAAIEGLQIRLGRFLFPALLTVVTGLSQTAVWINQNGTVMKPLIGIVAALTVAWVAATTANKIQTMWLGLSKEGTIAYSVATKVAAAGSAIWAGAQWLVNAALIDNPIGIVIVAVAALVGGIIFAYKHSETFRKIVTTAFTDIKIGATAMAIIAVGAFKFLANVWMTVAGAIIHGAANAFGWVPGLGPKLRTAAANFDTFKTGANAALDRIHNKLVVSLSTQVAQARADALAAHARSVLGATIFAAVQYRATGVQGAKIGRLAGGTPNFGGGLTTVGEEGWELVELPRGTKVHSHKESMQMVQSPRSLGGGGGGGGSIVVQLVLDGQVIREVALRDGKAIQQSLLKTKRSTGAKLGLG